MGSIQNNVNQLLGIAGAMAYLGNKEYEPKLQTAKAEYQKIKGLEKEQWDNEIKQASGLLAEAALLPENKNKLPSKAEMFDEGLTEQELSLVGKSGGLMGKIKGVKELENKTNEAYSNMLERDSLVANARRDIIKSEQFQKAKSEATAEMKKILKGASHMRKEGKPKSRFKQGFTLFLEDIKKQGISEKYIKNNRELLKKKYKESGLTKKDFEE